MKKINESVKLDCQALTDLYPDYVDQLNNIADSLMTAGAEVNGDDTDMYISGVSDDVISDVLYSEYNLDLTELTKNGIIEDLSEVDDMYMNESWELDDDYYDWDDADEENMEIIRKGRPGKRSKTIIDVTDDDMMFDDLDECDGVVEDIEFDDDEILNDDDMFDDDIETDIEFDDDPFEVDDYEEIDMYEDDKFNEDDEFMECLTESVNKRKGCCPPVKNHKNGKRLVNLYEAVSRPAKRNRKHKENLSINESIFTNALNKLKVSKKTQLHNTLKKALGANKYTDINNALKEGRTSLYMKKRINGKNIQQYTNKELFKLLKEVSEQIKTLTTKSKSINESVKSEKINNELDIKKRLLQILDEELTYRLTVKKYLNEDEEASDTTTSTEETSTEDTESSEEIDNTDPEKDEEVELARVIITVANQAAADDLKSELVDAGVPEDAIEFETEDDEEASEESTEETENSEDTEDTENSEDTEDTESSEESTDTNESLHVNVFRKLLEDEETEDTADAETSEESTEESADESEEESGDDKPVKVILVNTDYINTLAQVLSDVYGIEQDEFEEMIGGAIVTDDEESTEDSEESTEEKSDDTDTPSSNGDDAIDNMSDDDLAQLFGEAAK